MPFEQVPGLREWTVSAVSTPDREERMRAEYPQLKVSMPDRIASYLGLRDMKRSGSDRS
jgi:hypothetical protein